MPPPVAFMPSVNYASGMMATPPTVGTPPPLATGGPFHVLALIPVFNDWEAVGLLLAQLDEVIGHQDFTLEVMLIDDASHAPCPEGLADGLFALEHVSVLSLRRNLGHQRAIAIGLAHAEATSSCDAVLIMDGDGEDDPRVVPRLVARVRQTGGTRIVFAERTRRSEGPVFCAGYLGYRLLYRLLTGQTVRSGNFSVVPRPMLRRLTILSELWNHYNAAVIKARLSHERIPSARAARLAGRPKMNFVSLAVHGLSALSVFSEVIGVRLLLLSGMMMASLMMVLGAVLGLRLFTDLAVPGWASTVGGLALVLLLQTFALGVCFVFIILQSRGNTTFLPARDHVHFIDRLVPLAGQAVRGRPEYARGSP
ncbi:MAG: glycosyltransferase [Gemmataceae bacterium]